MPLIPIGHHHYILPGGEQVFTFKNSEVLQKITRTQGNLLRKAETESYLRKKAKKLLQQWTKELREASTKYHQCVIHIKELFRIQSTGEPPPDKSLILVKKLRLKRSSPNLSPCPPLSPPLPGTKTPRPPKRSRIPISTWRKNDQGRLGGRCTDDAKIPSFLRDGEDSSAGDDRPVTPSTHVWSPEPGSASGRFCRVGSTARRRPRTAPNESELLIGLRDDVRRKINFRDL
ncbi:hypothetical protein AOL_s00110g245 [Orbilia oligospora ATCC 24927]|uniref:Uncharacterized protein n=1 Tax=Arthrobotrys oligospora (strain ATCC 24927 / CBS 115.81 / DSM 1491) TaxID=756982 RepID=G1XL75_ARTOA|nr:hypothetical protein AOL_s00110g245 [Orbilia oligospora ATCC 24927]EGX46081.1 hypothetical protein AOL_s00110g245 [Orbilia oligospora ATCC 24927]